MITNVIKSSTRGSADYGWLKANYSFSFSNYYNPDQVHFGKLRVLNDDIIAAGRGFSTHPHADMEIITIPLKGALAHEDSTGSKGVIRPGEVQIMSAGTGIEHSEKNAIKNGETNILQIWIFPKLLQIKPRYAQQYFEEQQRINQWQPVVSNLHPGALDINQDAVISLAKLDPDQQLDYSIHFSGNGVFLFVIDGEVEVDGQILKTRDAITLENTTGFKVISKYSSQLLSIEVPMM